MKVAVVILNWNGKQLLEQFLPSVVQYSKEATVYVADNASTDDSVAFVKDQFPEVSIVVNPTNTGYAGGYNDSLQHIEADVYALVLSLIHI
jgi:GT2 family glycosyltransferase